MRIRSTKPEFWRSKTIASVSWEARLVLKGLESYVDDNGVGKDDIALIVGDIFQRDLVREPSRTLARVSAALNELYEGGLLWRYESDGLDLLYISSWESVQRVDRPQAGRFPRPDGTMNYKDSQIRECVANPRESSRAFAPGTGEQGNRGTGEQVVPHASVTLTRARDARDPEDRTPALVHDDGAPTATGIVREWERASGAPLTDSTRTAMRLAVSQCQRAGHTPDVIARGLADWANSKITATSQIPAFVDRAAVKPRLAATSDDWTAVADAADAEEEQWTAN